MIDDENMELAYHEAGHTVVGYVLGLELRDVTIVADEGEDYAGRVNIPVDLEMVYGDESNDYINRRLVCYLAGAVAEEILTGEQVDFRPGGVYTDDWTGAADCVLDLAGPNEERQAIVGEKAFGRTNAIPRNNWTATEALADALLKHGTITFEQVSKIIELAKRERSR